MKFKDILIPLFVVVIMVCLVFLVLSVLENEINVPGGVDCINRNPSVLGVFPWILAGVPILIVVTILFLVIAFVQRNIPNEDEIHNQINENGGKQNANTK